MAENKKQAFDKIRSAVERRHLFENAMKEKTVLLCKFGEDEDLVQLAVSAMQDEILVGRSEKPIRLQDQQTVLGNFAVGEDRYFFTGTVDIRGRYVSISTAVEVFKLERRKTLRVPVPEGYALTANLTEVNGRSIFQAAQVVDVSAGGIRLFLPQNPQGTGITVGSPLKGILRLPSTKTLDFDGTIRHLQTVSGENGDVRHFGLEFGACQASISQRLIVLTFDIQRKMTSGY